MPDFECTWWPDSWFGISLTRCCIEHDLGGSDLAFWGCIASLHPSFWVLGLVMFIGLKLFGPVYRMYRRSG